MLLNSLRLQGGVSRQSGCALGARESLYLQGGMPGSSTDAEMARRMQQLRPGFTMCVGGGNALGLIRCRICRQLSSLTPTVHV